MAAASKWIGVPETTESDPAAMVIAHGFSWNDYSRKMYLYRKTKRTRNMSGENLKTWRVWVPNYVGHDTYMSVNPGVLATENICLDDDNSEACVGYSTADLFGKTNEWNVSEIIYRNNSSVYHQECVPTPPFSDGVAQVYTNGVLGINVGPGLYYKWFKMKDDATPDMTWNFFLEENLSSATWDEADSYWADDVYADSTWARVMIGNASTLASSTRREIQIPRAWSDATISITVNLGTFASVEGTYLFVVNALGAVSPGYPLGSVDYDVPGQPSAPVREQ